MLPVTTEWAAKAEGDFVTALREYRARKQPNFDAACFPAQQSAEKYIKALLQEQGVAFDKTHDLIRLSSLLSTPLGLAALKSNLAELSAAAVEFRYPGETATREVARASIATCRAVRSEVRHQLGIPQ